jgi:hypothetical protein
MNNSRRDALTLGAAAALAGLESMTTDVAPMSGTEFLARIDKARALMGKLGIGALLVEPGASRPRCVSGTRTRIRG